MNVHEYISAIRKQWLVIVILTIVGAASAYGVAQTMPDMYRSTSSALASSASGENTSELVQGSTYVEGLVESYATVATSPIVLDPVIKKLGLDTTAKELKQSVTATTPLNTVIVNVTVENPDPAQAQQIASAVIRQLAVAVDELPPRSADDKAAVALTIISPAAKPESAFSPDTKMIVAIGAAIGLALGLAWSVLRELVDTRIRSQKDVALVTDSPLLAEVARTPRERGVGEVIRSSPNGATAESFRALCTSLAFADVDKPVSAVVVTSAMPGEGKSSVAVGLALSLSESNERVLLIDADLRRPSVADYTGLDGAVGLTTVLLGDATVEDAVQSWGAPGLDVLVSGSVPPNPNQLLASDTMRATLSDLKSRYDFIVIDTSPLIPVTDPLWLVHETDGAIVVARTKKTRRPQLAKAMGTLGSIGARVLGVVVNDVKAQSRATAYVDADEDTRRAIVKRVEEDRDSTPTATGPTDVRSSS